MDTRTRIARKCGAERGASILMALFLMLVCVTISSVILAAATASAGRLAKLAESDRRYYAVSSAAELIVDMVKDKEVVVTETRTAGDDGSSYTYTKPDIVALGTDAATGDETTVVPDQLTEMLTNLLIYGQDSTPESGETFWASHEDGTWAASNSTATEVSFATGPSGLDAAKAAEVTVTAQRKTGGIVEVTITSKKTTSDTNELVYKSRLVLSPYVEIAVDDDESPETISIDVTWAASTIQVVR